MPASAKNSNLSGTALQVPVRPANPADATYPPTLPIELALGLNSPKEICDEYGLSRADFEAISRIPQFIAQFDWAMEEKERPGGLVRLQCAMMSQDAVRVMHTAMMDVENNINQRAGHAKDILRFAGFEPERRKEASEAGERFAININFNGGGEPKIIHGR